MGKRGRARAREGRYVRRDVPKEDTDDQDLDEVRAAAAAEKSATEQLRQVVATARERGQAWQGIADALGVTRQAASQRFGRSS